MNGFGRSAVLAAATALCATTAAAWASEGIEQKPGEPCGLCEAKKELHELAPWLKVGADLRFRQIYQDNRRLTERDSSGDRVWQRYRARAWATIRPAEDLEFTIRFATEPRYFFKPDDLPEQLIREEVLVDQFSIRWAKALGLPVTITAGRQDITLGDGWLVRRGTSRDGSRTNFFDAIRTTLDLADVQTKLDLIYLRNHANSSWFIRPFNDIDLDLSEQDETGVIVYASNRSCKDTVIDGYFIYKHDDKVAADGNNADIYTFGARVAGPAGESWKYRLEAAPQFGHKNGVTIHALGANSELTYLLKDKLNNRLRMGYEYRSGDSKPGGEFDILWGRWIQWSDAFTGNVDTLEGQSHRSANIHRLTAGWTCDPAEKLELLFDYHLLFADRNTFSGTTGFSNNGLFRGQLLTAALNYVFNEHLKGHLKAELFCPGNYYDKTRNDVAVYLQYELSFSW